MAINVFKCKDCDFKFKSMQKKPDCPKCASKAVAKALISPQSKLLEKVDADRNKSQMKDQMQILKERSRNYTRDNELDDLTQTNDMETAKKNQWVKEDGTKRRKIDDI